jgi:formate dehydrogenase major subunit
MPHVNINGHGAEFPDGTTILTACRQMSVEVPTLCHDERLQPSGACRLCVVAVKGWNRHATACNTPLAEGMEIETHPAEVEQVRRTLLGLLAQEYPSEVAEQWLDKQFHRWLQHYGLTPGAGRRHSDIINRQSPIANTAGEPVASQPFQDSTHPYIHVDMSHCITCFRCLRICDELQGQFTWRAWNRGDATRIRPDSGSTLLASSCVSCGACVDTCPTGALDDKSILKLGTPTSWTRTTCPYCGTGCEMNVGVRDGRIVQVKPVLDAPVSKGHLCVKGRYAFEFVHAPDRIKEPMIRTGNQWCDVSWSEAIQHIAINLKRISKEQGPDSIGVLGSARATNEENYLAQKFARVVLGTNNIDCCARVCHGPTAAAMKTVFGAGAATNSFNDIELAQAILICGCNPTENHPIVGARIKQAALRGAKLIVIDPREIELARYGVIHLQLHPGTNIPLLNALAQVIVSEGLFDETALRERISEFEEFRKFIAPWTPEYASDITGVSVDLIRQAARIYATAKPAICFHGLGMTEHVQGTEGVMSLSNLALLTGNFGKPGSGVNPLRGQNNVQGSAHMGCEPGKLTGYVGLAEGRQLFEKVWNTSLPANQGLNLMQMIDAAGRGTLKALWAIGYDVALTNPDALTTIKTLKSIGFVIVQDMFMNELARECGSVFLPVASSFEKEGTFMNSERRVQRVRKAIEPPGQAKADWEIICEVARALGHGGQFDFHSAEEIWEEIREVWKAGHGITYGRLESGGLQWPCPSEEHPGTTILHTGAFPHGPRSALQRIEFRPSAEAASPKFPYLLTTGRTLYQFNAGTMTMRTANAVLRPVDTVDISLVDAGLLGLKDGALVRLRSHHGETVLAVRIDPGMKPGELFATFHTAQVSLNRLTGPARDHLVQTPEYKVVAVAIEKIAASESAA